MEVLKPIVAIALRAAFVALPISTKTNAQAVLCYRSYFPAGPRQCTRGFIGTSSVISRHARQFA